MGILSKKMLLLQNISYDYSFLHNFLKSSNISMNSMTTVLEDIIVIIRKLFELHHINIFLLIKFIVTN